MADADPPTVLIIEDDDQVRSLYRTVLEADYEVRTAASGAEGLDRLDPSVDVVLLDRRMPRMSGDEALVRLRESGYAGPVVMVTAVEPELDIIDLPFDGYVVKPVSPAELVEVIESMLDRTAYDEAVREFFALGSKVATLETDHTRVELEAQDRYRDLLDRLAAARAASRDALARLSSEEVLRLYRDIDSAAFRSPPDED